MTFKGKFQEKTRLEVVSGKVRTTSCQQNWAMTGDYSKVLHIYNVFRFVATIQQPKFLFGRYMLSLESPAPSEANYLLGVKSLKDTISRDQIK